MVAPPASNVREARQLSTHGQKFDPESLYEPIKFETLNPYLVQQISILDPLTLDFLVRLGLNFHPMGELREGGRLGRRHIFFCHGQKRDYLSRAWQRATGATKNGRHRKKRLYRKRRPRKRKICLSLSLSSSVRLTHSPNPS